MPHSNIIPGESEQEIWKTIADQLSSKKDEKDYTAQFPVGKHCVTLHVDIHPDSSGEIGDPITAFTAPLPVEVKFRFRVVKQNLKHGIGKLFGMQDVIIGHPDFDKKFLIQSNDETKVKEVLSDADVANTLLNNDVVDFEIREHKLGAHRETILALEVEGGITDPIVLEKIYQPIKKVLSYL